MVEALARLPGHRARRLTCARRAAGPPPSAMPVLVLVGIVLLSFNLRGPLVAVSTVTGDLTAELGMSAHGRRPADQPAGAVLRARRAAGVRR